ncbi:MAG: lipopolysaccharide kinase InaA family protein [Planctomycetota bacterium]
MNEVRVQLAPGVPDLAALGVDDAVELLAVDRLPSRGSVLASGERESLVRYPLPGTVGPDGRRGGKPRGAGTGWLRLQRFHRSSLGELVRVRFTAPRSLSLAERAWNVACHLRAHGIGTPELLAVGAGEGGLFARASFLVTRELDGHETLERWLGEALSPAARRKGALALGHALGQILAAGVVLPELGPRSLHLSIEADEPEGHACEHGPEPGEGGPRKNRMPSVAVSAFGGARVAPGGLAARAAALAEGLLAGWEPPASAGWRFAARVLVAAARVAGLERDARARLWRTALARTAG